MFTLSLVTPDKRIVTDAEVDEVIVPGHGGELDILPGHAPLITTLSVGALKYRLKGSSTLETVVLSWGYCEVHKNGVTILAETAETPSEIDKARAETALKEAQEQLANSAYITPDQITTFQRKLDRARTRLQVLGGNDTTH